VIGGLRALLNKPRISIQVAVMRIQVLLFTIAFWLAPAYSKINRKQVIQRFNPVRLESSNSTPTQVGNGNFAFGVDVTGLQTFKPFGTLSSWGWHNFSLPNAPGQSSLADFTGLDW